MNDRRPTSPDLVADDLAPGDRRSLDLDWSGLRLERIKSPDHPLFSRAYRRLWREFGPSGGMEREEVIAARFEWDPAQPVADHALLYEMLVVLGGEEIVAVRDHTAIQSCASREEGRVVVHLSHNLVEPSFRGSGLAGWLRALPLQVARECAARTGTPASGLTLVAEMEQPAVGEESAALRSYGRAGFKKIDPDTVRYFQPDFRAPDEIDRTSVHSVPFALVIRRVGRESEESISSREARALITALYAMFGAHIRAGHMRPLWDRLDHLPSDSKELRLEDPSAK